MTSKEETLKLIEKILDENSNVNISILSHNGGEEISKLDVDKNGNRSIFNFSKKTLDKIKSYGRIEDVYFSILEHQNNVSRVFNTLDFDVEFARSIHPDYDINWEQNLDKHLNEGCKL